MVESDRPHRVVTGAPRSGKSTALAGRIRRLWSTGLSGDRMLVLVPDRRSARRLGLILGDPPAAGTGRVVVMSYHSFAQDLIRRWWPLVMAHLGIQAATPEFLPFNLAQFACLSHYREDPGNLQRLTIREQRLIVQVLSNMNLSAGNGLTLEDGWERVAAGLGVPPGDPVIQDGLALTRRFRQCCLEAGVMPVDLQVEAASWLLGEQAVRDDFRARHDLLALDDLDEFVPIMAERLTSLAGDCAWSIVTCGDEGGLRWLLGASAERAQRICESLVESGRFEHTRLDASFSRSAAVLTAAADRLARAVAGEASPPAGHDVAGIHLHEAHRMDEMARQVVDRVEQYVTDGTPPGEIALLIPYMETLVSTELGRLFTARGIPFRVDQRWRSVLDDPLARACLTALRCANSARGVTRKPALVEVADLLTALTEADPIDAHRWARAIYRSGALIDASRSPGLPYEVRRVSWWASKLAREEALRPLHEQLELLARYVIAPHSSEHRAELVRTCYGLANEARRFCDAAPRLGLDVSVERGFFDYVDSDIVGADTGVDRPGEGVTLTTPYVFLTSGRTARHQCWLNVASPSWWEPPLLLLTNPHAMAMTGSVPSLTSVDDDRIRGEVLGRIIRNLTARCDGDIHAFASFTGSDGALLEGPLYDCLVEMLLVPA